MIIALDFDETYTVDPELWTAFVIKARVRLHTVTFVTFRAYDSHGNSDIEFEAKCLGIDIVYTAGKQKQHCFSADVWIDDSPELIASYDKLGLMKIGCEINGDIHVAPYIQILKVE
jgi:hypothetical protein|tara:strand:+ start:337 stop:684 length:348 start_codon:yes stop_codon:yes gene_type:complete